MRVGVIGAGAWGINLVRTLNQLGYLAGVAESAPDLRARVLDVSPDIPVFERHQELLDSDVHCVCVATPAPTHFDIAMEALFAGKDVFVEKPLTLRSCEAERLVETAEARSRILMVGHLLLYQPAMRWTKGALQAGIIGKVHSFHQSRLNLGKVRSAENVLWSLGVHDLAALLYLAGDSEAPELTVSSQNVLQRNIADDVYVHLKFASGLQAHLHTSWLWPEMRRQLTIVGETGMLTYEEVSQTVTLHKKTIDDNLSARDLGSEVVFAETVLPLTLELEHFVHCAQTRDEPVSSGRSALPVIRLLERISEQLL